MSRRVTTVLVAAGAAVLLAGCGGAEPPSAPAEPAGGSGFPALPARPVELPLNGVEPCDLLTPAQLQGMRVPPRTASKNSGADRFGSVGCSWGTAYLPPYGSPGIRLVTAQPVGYFEYMIDRGQIAELDGFPVARDVPAPVRPDEGCVLFVDIAEGQTLEVRYDKLYAQPGTINREQACAKAREVGQAVIATLRARQGK